MTPKQQYQRLLADLTYVRDTYGDPEDQVEFYNDAHTLVFEQGFDYISGATLLRNYLLTLFDPHSGNSEVIVAVDKDRRLRQIKRRWNL